MRDPRLTTHKNDSHLKKAMRGETGLTLQQEEAIALIVHRDVNQLSFQEIADKVGVDKSTLYRWRQKKEFNDVLLEQSEEVQRNFLTEAYNSLRHMLSDPNTKEHTRLKAIELVLKNQGRLKEVNETKHEVEQNSMEELMRRLEDI